MENQYTKELEKLAKRNNNFIFANIDLKWGKVEWQTIWAGFKNKRELRGPRFEWLPEFSEFEKWKKIGYDIIVYDDKSFDQWVIKGTGKAIFHKSIIRKFFPYVLKPLETLSSAEHFGFFSPETEIGKKLARKRLSRTEKRELYEEFGRKCVICSSSENLSIHHILKREFGGGTEILNSVPVCQSCHGKLNKGIIDHRTLYVLRYRK